MATTYLTTEEAETLLGYEVTEAEVLQAESDLDDIALGAHENTRSTEAPFRKLNPDKLTPVEEDHLKRATAEQIKYRRLMGEEFFSRPQRDKSSAEGISVEGRLPHIGERVTAILADVGLINRLGTYSTKPVSDMEDIGWEPY